MSEQSNDRGSARRPKHRLLILAVIGAFLVIAVGALAVLLGHRWQAPLAAESNEAPRALTPQPEPASTPKPAETLMVPVAVVGETRVRYFHETRPPWSVGNCFRLAQESGKPLAVANMHAENFKAMVEKLNLKSIQILPIEDSHCLIVDARIPKEWLLDKPCSICTRESLRQELDEKHADKFNRGTSR